MNRVAFGIIILLSCAGCSKEMEQPSMGAMQFSGTIVQAASEAGAGTGSPAGITPETRTSMSGSTASFISGDNIGISETVSGRRNVRFSFNGSAWSTTTPMYWYNGTSTHTFYAYYPYNASNSGNLVTIPLLSGQAFASTPDVNCDMLVAGPKTQVRTSGTSVALAFTHAFSLLQFNISSPLISTYTLKSLTIQGGNTAGGSSPYGIVNSLNDIEQVWYNLQSQAVQTTNNNSSTYAQSINKTIATTGLIGAIPITVYAIILPGTYANPVPGIQFFVSSLLGGNQTTKLAALPNTTFQPGTKYVYTVQVGGILARSNPRADLTAQQPVVAGEIELICNLSNKPM